MQSITITILLILSAILCFPHAHAQDGEKKREKITEVTEDGEVVRERITVQEEKQKKVVTLKGVSNITFRAMCDAMHQDARLEKFAEFAAVALASASTCDVCRPFYKAISVGCKPKRVIVPKAKKKPKKTQEEGVAEGAEEEPAEPTPTPPLRPKQREPSLLLIDLTSNVFAGLSESPSAVEVLPALDDLLERLRDRSSMTPGEYDYFSTLATYMERPFEKVRVQAEEEHQLQLKEEDL